MLGVLQLRWARSLDEEGQMHATAKTTNENLMAI